MRKPRTKWSTSKVKNEILEAYLAAKNRLSIADRNLEHAAKEAVSAAAEQQAFMNTFSKKLEKVEEEAEGKENKKEIIKEFKADFNEKLKIYFQKTKAAEIELVEKTRVKNQEAIKFKFLLLSAPITQAKFELVYKKAG